MVRVAGRRPCTCRMSPGGMLSSPRSQPPEALCTARMPCFALGRLKPRHSIMSRGDSSRGSLEDSDGAGRTALVVLPPSAPHEPTRSDAGDAACLAHTCTLVLIGIDLLASLLVHRSCSAGHCVLCPGWGTPCQLWLAARVHSAHIPAHWRLIQDGAVA